MDIWDGVFGVLAGLFYLMLEWSRVSGLVGELMGREGKGGIKPNLLYRLN